MRKTLFLTNDFGPRAGGIETFVHGLIERLPKGSVMVYTSQQGDTSSYDQTWLDTYGVKVFRDRSKMLLPTPRVIWKVRKLMQKERPENLVFGAAAPLAIAGKLLPANRKIALTHGHEVWWAKVPPFNLLIRLIGNSVDHLTYLGQFTKSEIAKGLSKKAKSKMIQISPGIDTEHFRPIDSAKLRAELGIADKEVIVSVGRLVPRKGQDILIKAMPKILKTRADAHLLLVGSGPYQSKLENLIVQLNLQGHVSFTGRVQYQELPAYLCAGDIFAMPARSRFLGLEVEGLGIVYLEASGCGLPVLAGDSGGSPDAVDQGVTGLVVKGTDVDQVADGAIKLLSADRSAMGKAGRDFVVSNWDWSIWAKRFNGLLELD